MRQVLTMLAENSPDTLLRILGIMRRHVATLESLVMDGTEDPTLCQVRVVCTCKDGSDRLQRQLEKQIGVVQVSRDCDLDLAHDALVPVGQAVGLA